MGRRLARLEVVYQRRRRVISRPDLSMLSDDELLELEAIGQACEPSLLDPMGVGALTSEQQVRLDDLLAKVERGADGATA